MKLWGKDKTHSRREIFRARGREEILHTWEREKAFQKRKRSDCIARAQKSRREFAALFFLGNPYCTDCTAGRTEGTGRTAEIKTKNHTAGTFLKVLYLLVVGCTVHRDRGTVWHEFSKLFAEEERLYSRAVQQHLLLVFISWLLHISQCIFQNILACYLSCKCLFSLSLIKFLWVLPHRGEGFALGLALNFLLF